MEALPTHSGVLMLDLAQYTFHTIYRELSQVGNESVMEYIRRNQVMTDHEFRVKFTHMQRVAIAKYDTTDIILLYKLLQTVCSLEPHNSPVWKTPSDTLEFHLRNAKLLSNDLTHIMYNSPTKVGKKCSELKKELQLIVTKVEEKIGRRLDNIRQRLASDNISPAYKDRELVLLPLEQLNKVIFRMIYKHYNKCNLNIKDFCFQNLGFSKKLYMKTFLTTQRQIIDLHPSVNELDTFILYKVLEKAIDKEDYLYNCFKNMKTLRNEVAHEEAKNECSYKAFILTERVLLELSARSGQTFHEILVQMGRELFLEATIALSVPQTSHVALSSSAVTPSTTTVPIPAVTPSTTTVQIPAVTPSTTAVPITNLIPSTTTAPTPAVTPSTTTVPIPAVTPSTTAVPIPNLIPSTTTSPMLAVTPSTTTAPTPAVTPSTTTTLIPGTSTAGDTSVYKKEDMNVVRAFAALKRGGPAAKTFATVFDKLFPLGLKHLEEYCKNVSTYTNEQLKSLRKELKKPIEQDMTPSDLDITCLYKCLGYVGLMRQDKWPTQDDTMEQYLYYVKMKRNFLAHEVVYYSDHDLAKLFDDLQLWLPKILRLLREVHDKDVSIDFIKEIKKTLQCIYNEPLPAEDINNYCRRMQEIRKALSMRTLARSRAELQKYYANSKYKVVTPVTWYCHSSDTNWDITELYTELKILGSDNVTETISDCNLFSQLNSASKVLVVEGVAGSGKTSLCKFAVNCWKNTSGIDGLVDIDLLIFIQCRNINSETLTSFLSGELLKETFHECEDVMASLGDARLLFIVDGFDEARPGGRALLHDALTKFASSSFIITTRPEFRSDLEVVIAEAIGSQKINVYQVVGFQDTKREDYIRKLFGVLGGNADSFLRYLETIDRYLGSFTQLPLTLALLALLWNNDEKTVSEMKTVTQIYKEILKYFKGRLVKRQKDRPYETCHAKDIERKVNKWMQTLAQIAWKKLQKNMMYLSEEDETILRDEGNEQGIDPTDALSCLLQCNMIVTRSQCYENWEFFHKTIEEFLAASHLMNVITKNNVSLDSALELSQSVKLDQVNEYSRLIQFIAGNLVEEKSMTKVRAQQVLQLFKHHLPWVFESIMDLSRECKSSIEFTKSLGDMFGDMTLQDELMGYEPKSLHCVLEKTALSLPHENVVIIAISSKDAGNMKPLLNLLSNRGCFARVMLPGNRPQSVKLITETLCELTDPSNVEIVFGCQVHDAFPTLVEAWPWQKPLHVTFSKPAILLLWLKFMACLALHSISPSKIQFSGASQEQNHAVETFAKRLGISYSHFDTSPGEFIINL